MAQSVLSVTINNVDRTLRPSGVRIKELLRIGELIEAAVVEATGRELDQDGGPLVTLAGVKDGSLKIALAVAAVATPTATAILGAVVTADYSRVPPNAQDELAQLSNYLIAREWSAKLSGLTDKPVVIDAANPVPVSKRVRVAERRTIYGECIQSGGVNPQAKLRLLSNRRLLSVSGSEQLVQQLGTRLYDVVGVAGTAVIDAATREVLSFQADAMTPYSGNKANPVAALNTLGEISRRVESVSPIDRTDVEGDL